MMVPARRIRLALNSAVLLALAAVLLAMAPFAVALEVHHELAAADGDGHQHSDTDLCQWVQSHTGSSLPADAPALPLWDAPIAWMQAVRPDVLSSDSAGSASPRAPPRS